jgi:D-alanyl-D-alanine dipeptidase
MSYTESRVTVAAFGSLPRASGLLVPVPTAVGYPQQRMHVVAAKKFGRLSDAILDAFGYVGAAASGWRPHRWTSRQQYEQRLISQYGSVAKGRLYLAFDSPHETGLAVDLGCGGLEPRSATIAQQRSTPLYRWLVANMDQYGAHPYLIEPWHIEFPVSDHEYQLGVEDTSVSMATARPSNDVCEDNSCIEAPLDTRVWSSDGQND